MFGCSRDGILELKVEAGPVEEAFCAERLESARHIGYGFFEVFDEADALGRLPDCRGGTELGIPQHQADSLVDDGAENRAEASRSWLTRRRPRWFVFLVAERQGGFL